MESVLAICVDDIEEQTRQPAHIYSVAHYLEGYYAWFVKMC